jgi:hypothetical protein
MLRRLFQFFLGCLIGIGIGALLLGIVAYFLRDQLWKWAQDQLSSQFSARIVVRDFSVDGWRGFPALTLTLYEPVLTTFSGETLFTSQQLAVYLNLYELLIERRYRITGVSAEAPYLCLRWDKAGRSVWQTVFRPAEDTTQTAWQIEKLVLRKGRLRYIDERGHISFLLDSLGVKASINHTPHSDTTWHFMADIRTALRQLAGSAPTSFPLALAVQGAFCEKSQALHFYKLEGSLSALRVSLGGMLRWREGPLYVQLGIRRLYIDFARLGQFWPRLPSEWQTWPGHISAAGTLQGFLGRGYFPAIRLQATLHQKKPFRIHDYALQTLYAQVRLVWNPLSPRESLLTIDSLSVRGMADSLTGSGSYVFAARKGMGQVQGQLALSTLRILGVVGFDGRVQGKATFQLSLPSWHMDFTGQMDSLRYDTLRIGAYRGRLSLGQSQETWHIEAQGHLRELLYGELRLAHAELRWTTSAITLSQVKAQYGTLQVEAPTLTLQPATEPWKQKHLLLAGYLHLPVLPFPLPVSTKQMSDTTPTPDVSLHLHVAADTLLWQSRRYGPLRAVLYKGPDTLTLRIQHLSGFAQGSLTGTILNFAQGRQTIWDLQVKAQNLHIPTLRRDLPELDSLFPLLPHLQGQVSADVHATLPLLGERLLWTEATGEAHIHLQHFVVAESPYTYKLFAIIPLTDFKRIQVGEVRTRLTLRDGVIQIDTTLLQANEWRLHVSGSHTLKNDLSYHLLVELPRNLLLKNPSQVADIVEEEGERLRIRIDVTGSAENPTFRWQPASQKAQKPSKSGIRGPLSPASPGQRDSQAAPAKKSGPAREKPLLPVEESPR